MSEPPALLLASGDPQELIQLMLDAADGCIDPADNRGRRGFQIALDAVSTPPASSGERPRSRASTGRELIELLLAAAVAQVAADDRPTLAGVEVALNAVLSMRERPGAEVLAERLATSR